MTVIYKKTGLKRTITIRAYLERCPTPSHPLSIQAVKLSREEVQELLDLIEVRI